VIQQATVAPPGTYGEQALSWSTFATVWAEVKPVSGGERFSMGQERANVTHEIRIRYLAGILPNMRVQFTRDDVTHTFQIHNILEESFRGAEMVLSCEEVDVGASTLPVYSTLTFAGDTNYSTCAQNSTTLNITGNMTIEFWLKHAATVSATECVMSKYGATSDIQSWRIDLSTAGKLLFVTRPGLLTFTTTAAVIADAFWHRFVIVKTGTVVTVSKDGVDVPGTGAVDATMREASAEVVIGNRWAGFSDFAGSLACIRIWNVARTAAQSAATATEVTLGPSYAASGLVAEWVDPGTGNLTFPDRSGNGNTLTLDTSVTKPTVSGEYATLPSSGGSTP